MEVKPSGLTLGTFFGPCSPSTSVSFHWTAFPGWAGTPCTGRSLIRVSVLWLDHFSYPGPFILNNNGRSSILGTGGGGNATTLSGFDGSNGVRNTSIVVVVVTESLIRASVFWEFARRRAVS
ncbi:unnamed protein product [Haemonchus placei]|uniref:Uncharacterized protein n=1 Tax=Haemonchus placei TaxID=6290 RepID=A0A0N4X4C2_HAEPC|nr:unnamed protein product [Haemonchus placei]